MTDPYDFGLTGSPEKEKEVVFSYLNKKTIVYKPLLSALIETAYKIQTSKTLSDSDIETFKKGLFESYVVVFSHYSGKFLCQLSFIDKRVQALLIELATHQSSKVRLNNITNMLYHPYAEVLSYVIDEGLKDKSASVRSKTADTIERLELKEYSKVLPAFIHNEGNAKVKKALELCLYWLTHDYEIYEKTEFGYSIWVKTGTGMTGVTINEKQYNNLDATIDQIKNGTFTYD